MTFVVWIIMNNLAEMVTYLPLRGITIPYFTGRFVDPSLAFALGWNYWYAYSILIGAEATAAGIVIDYWNLPVHGAVWIAIVLAVILVLNIVAVGFFGEAEFWFTSIKVLTICGLTILGIVLFFGGGPNQHGVLGFHYWSDPGAFNEYLVPGSLGRFLGVWNSIIKAAFAFISSPELIAIAAGETVSPRRNIPKAARRFVWRLAIFYGLSSLIIGVIVPSTDSRLLGASSDASASPFTIAIQQAGIPVLNHIINATILTSAWSAGNSFLYSGSRVLYSIALEGNAPRIFKRVTTNGVPWVAVLATWAIGALGFLNVSNTGSEVFGWLSNIATISALISWVVVMITYLRFRASMQYHALLETLPYKTPLQPYATYVVLALVLTLTWTNGFAVFISGHWDVRNFLAAYITIPIFLLLYVIHKAWFRTPWVIPTKDTDAETGRREMERLELLDEPRIAKNSLHKIWLWIA